jgi:hypothetical protein
MVGAHAGLWPELVNDGSDIELAVKLNSDLAKAILKGAIVTLMVAVIQVSGQLVRIVGLRIEDGIPSPTTRKLRRSAIFCRITVEEWLANHIF